MENGQWRKETMMSNCASEVNYSIQGYSLSCGPPSKCPFRKRGSQEPWRSFPLTVAKEMHLWNTREDLIGLWMCHSDLPFKDPAVWACPVTSSSDLLQKSCIAILLPAEDLSSEGPRVGSFLQVHDCSSTLQKSLSLLCCCLEVYLQDPFFFPLSFSRVRTLLCVFFYLSLVTGIPFYEFLAPQSLVGIFLPEGLNWERPSFKCWHWRFVDCWYTLIPHLFCCLRQCPSAFSP